MSAVALADVVGVTRAAISQYENGHQSPSPDVMRSLSTALNVPIQRFIRPVRATDDGTVFYRCMSSATKRARARAERRFGWLKDIADYVRQFMRFPAVKLPTFDLPREPSQIREELIEELATDCRRFWGLQDGPISNVTWLVENNGAIVSRFDLDAVTLDAFSQWRGEDERPYVTLSSEKQSAARSRFDVVHEMAHMLLHRHIDKAALNHNDSFKLIEWQAHRFAAAFLLPVDSFGREAIYPNLDGLVALKPRWGVSVQAMINRVSQLRLISESQERSLWVNLSRRKWKTREPYDDVLEPEQPRLLRRCIESMLRAKKAAPSDISFLLGLPPNDIEQLAGLAPGTLGQEDIEPENDDWHDDDDLPIFRLPNAS